MISEIQRVVNTLESGRVLRYHAAPTVAPQTVGQHAWGVMLLVIYLTNGLASRKLLLAAAIHDAAELITGDVPLTAKRDFPELKECLTKVEEAVHQNLVLKAYDLEPFDAAVLKLADTLEGLLWCQKTETGTMPVLGRWRKAFIAGTHKFEPIVGPDVINRARSLFTLNQSDLVETHQ